MTRRARLAPLVGTAGVLALLSACASDGPPTFSPPPHRQAARPAARPVPVEPQRPAWVARRVVADAVETPQGRFHTVKPGETGIAIARAYGVPWSRLVTLNQLKPPYALEVGDRLRLPSRQQVAAQSPAERARTYQLDIDDLITGGEPAEGGQLVAGGRPAARPTPPAATAPPVLAPVPVPAGPEPQFVWPVEGRVVSGFGPKAGGRFNDGINLKAQAGEAVRAAADGIVAYAGDAIAGFGNLLLIKHAGGWVSAYAHNQSLLVARGDRVRQGEPIARAGATGAVTEPQVHFELRRGRTPVDPAKVIGGR